MSTVETRPPATDSRRPTIKEMWMKEKYGKKMYYAEFTADLFDKKPRRFSSYVSATDRWRALDGLKARVGSNIRKIRIRRVINGSNIAGAGGAPNVLEV